MGTVGVWVSCEICTVAGYLVVTEVPNVRGKCLLVITVSPGTEVPGLLMGRVSGATGTRNRQDLHCGMAVSLHCEACSKHTLPCSRVFLKSWGNLRSMAVLAATKQVLGRVPPKLSEVRAQARSTCRPMFTPLVSHGSQMHGTGIGNTDTHAKYSSSELRHTGASVLNGTFLAASWLPGTCLMNRLGDSMKTA